MKILDLRQSTSLGRIQPEGGFGDVGEGGKVQGLMGLDFTGAPAPGQIPQENPGGDGIDWVDPSTIAADGLVPYYIASGDTYTVPLYKQALYSTEIDNGGTLDVIGLLLEVS